jgi:hypothetical protein
MIAVLASLALSVSAALAPLSAAPIAAMPAAQLDQQLSLLQQKPAIGDRIEALSQLFLGTPYVEFPLGEGGSGPEPQARFRLDGVDCQTFVETVLALANSGSLSQAQALLDDIRYAQLPPTFGHRNHFTEAQWLPSLTQKGYLHDEVPAIDVSAPTAHLELSRARWSQVPALSRLAAADIPEGRFPIRYLRGAELVRRQKSVEPGTVLLVVREPDPKKVVRVSHMGLVVRCGTGRCVRHASSAQRRVVEEELSAYVERMGAGQKWRVEGYGLYAPVAR